MEPKDDDITKQWISSNLSGKLKEYTIGADALDMSDAITYLSKMMKDNKITTKYVNDETLYAVKEQINWAGTMLKNKKWRKHLDSEELLVLQQILKNGTYYESEKPLLNNILKKYNEK